MPVGNAQYDVAISFLSRDEGKAQAIYDKLAEGLQVFFYPRKQEELAGTDGLASMRTPFLDSRLVVVLYRELWGKTPWTRVEETAIKDACLARGWQHLFFIVLDPDSALPVWLPQHHVRFNFADFGLEQAVGAIKARVQENGGRYLPLTPMRRVEQFNAEERYRHDKGRMNTLEGIEAILTSVSELFSEIQRHCAQINAQGLMQVRCGVDFRERSQIQWCGVTNGDVGLTIVWNQVYTNSLEGSGLVVRELTGSIMIPGETGRIYLHQASPVGETKYSPDLSRAREYGWKENHKTEFLSSAVLAEQCVIRFVDLAEHHARRER